MGTEVKLKYGENPHQVAFWRKRPNAMLIEYPKSISFNDLRNVNLGCSLLRYFNNPVAVVVKHDNVVGISIGESFSQRWQEAVATDRRAALNGLLIVNHALTARHIRELESFKFDGIFETNASKHRLFTTRDQAQLFNTKNKKTEKITLYDGTTVIQDQFVTAVSKLSDLHIYGNPFQSSEQDILMAWYIACSVKTNCAVLVSGGRTLAVAAGHQDGLTAIEHAIYKSHSHCRELDLSRSVIAVDGNFPNELPVRQLSEAKIKTFILPGMAMNDNELLKKCGEYNISVLFTRERCFLH